MADITARDILLGLVMATFFIVGGVALMAEFSKDDASYINPANYSIFNNTFNKYDDLSRGVTTMKSTVSGDNATGSLGENTDTFQDNIIFQAWNALTSIGSLFGFAFSASGSLLSGLSTMLGIPGWAVSFMVMLMIVALIWAILSLILKKG